jgi:hypothetical protein
VNFIWEVSREILAASGQTVSVRPDALLAKDTFPWKGYIFIGLVFAALVAAFFYAHPRKKKNSTTMRGGFNGTFGSFENFDGGFKSR